MRRGWFVLLFWRLLNPVMRPLDERRRQARARRTNIDNA